MYFDYDQISVCWRRSSSGLELPWPLVESLKFEDHTRKVPSNLVRKFKFFCFLERRNSRTIAKRNFFACIALFVEGQNNEELAVTISEAKFSR